MLFTGLEFLFFFFPLTYGVYFILPKAAKNYWLLAASLFFYAWGEPKFLFVMLLSIAVNYAAAVLIEKNRLSKRSSASKWIFICGVALDLGLLFVYKYLNFLTETLRKFFPALQSHLPQTSILLPIGISFFTFQAISYIADVYRGHPAQKNPFFVALYIALFPQLIAGPIVRYSTIEAQIQDRSVTLDGFSDGILHFLYGFNKKVLLANVLAEVADAAFEAEVLSVGMSWLGAAAYALQIYFDFSGYSEMAIGLGRMLGFEFPKNFDYPYISSGLTEFWRRWHISLGSWFRDYLYFPLGGSRVKSQPRLIVNLLAVWLATGIWHGAGWTFLLWGLLHGCFVIGEKLTDLPKRLETSRIKRAFYRPVVFFVVLFGWVLFRAPDMTHAITYFRAMFGSKGIALTDGNFIFMLREYAIPLTFAVLCSTPVFSRTRAAAEKHNGLLSTIYRVMAAGLQFILFAVSISCLIMSAHNPFIYFNF